MYFFLIVCPGQYIRVQVAPMVWAKVAQLHTPAASDVAVHNVHTSQHGNTVTQ